MLSLRASATERSIADRLRPDPPTGRQLDQRPARRLLRVECESEPRAGEDCRRSSGGGVSGMATDALALASDDKRASPLMLGVLSQWATAAALFALSQESRLGVAPPPRSLR
jgi:hypothetical protein